MGGNIFIHQVWQTWQQSMTHYDEEKHRNEDRQRQAPSGNPWQEPTGLGHNCCGSQAFGHKDPQSTLAARPCKTCKLLLDFFSGFVWTSRVNCVIGECLSAWLWEALWCRLHYLSHWRQKKPWDPLERFESRLIAYFLITSCNILRRSILDSWSLISKDRDNIWISGCDCWPSAFVQLRWLSLGVKERK